MKKNLLLSVAVFTCLALVSNQKASAQQWLTTGNNLVGGEKLGSLNNQPLNIVTNNTSRFYITAAGKVGILTTVPVGYLTVKGPGSNPASSWGGGNSVFTGFGETNTGSADFMLSLASDVPGARPLFLGKRSRGTLAAPTVPLLNDYLSSFVGSGFDGTTFQLPASVDFFVDGATSAGNVPARISFSTGSNGSNRIQRLKIGSTGDFTFNNTQLFLQQSTGALSMGSITPNASSILDINSTTKGVLLPRMTTAQRNAIVSPATGLLIYQTDGTPGFYYYSGGWVSIGASAFGANTTLSNLTAPTAINADLLPGTTATEDLGSSNNSWRNVYLSGNIAVGIDAPVAQVDVRNTSNINSVYVTNTSTNPTQFGVRSYVNGVALGSSRTAGEFLATGDGNNNTGISSSATVAQVNYGGTFTASGGTTNNIGTWGFASGPGGSTNYGVYGSIGASSSGNDWAGYFRGRVYASNRVALGLNEVPENAQLTVRTPDTSYNAIFASTANTGGNGILSTYSGAPNIYYAFWGIAPATAQNAAGYFSGNVTITGTLTNPSDERLKQNVKPLSKALDKIMKVGVHTYDFKPEFSYMNLAQGKQYGYLAQNLENVFPELVKNTVDKSKGEKNFLYYKTVNYIGMIPVLTRALQEEHEQKEEQIATLKAENEELKKRLEDVELAIAKLSLPVPGSISGEATGKLGQNSPNPFNQNSTISYDIPASAKSAMIVVYTIDGKGLKTFSNLSKGVGHINVEANSFAAGTYTYSLFIDGKQIETRKMIIKDKMLAEMILLNTSGCTEEKFLFFFAF